MEPTTTKTIASTIQNATSSSEVLSSIQRELLNIGNILGLPDTDPRLILARLIRIAMGFLGIIFVLLIMQSGLVLMTSGGNEEKVKHAKKIFFNAIIGIILILSAYSIVNFAVNAILP